MSNFIIDSFKFVTDALIITTQRDVKTSDSTTTSTSFVDLPEISLTIPNRSGGKFMVIANNNLSNSATVATIFTRFVDGGTNKNGVATEFGDDANREVNSGMALTGNLTGQTLKQQWRVSASTGKAHGASDLFCQMTTWEISE